MTEIGEAAFQDCSSLESVTIPESVTEIGEYAFDECSSLPVLDNIRYADTYLIEVIDKMASSFSINNNTRFIGTNAFKGCNNVKKNRLT